MRNPVILFVGGGTGGHISPLLAVMASVKRRNPDARLIYVGTAQDAASALVRDSGLGFEIETIPAGKLHRFLTLDQFRQVIRMGAGYFQAMKLLKRLKPDLIFSKGGMVGVPISLAASRLSIPVFCHETDAAPGMANRLVGRYAARIFTAFPAAAYKKLPSAKLVYAGQPVRPEFYAVPAWEELAVGNRNLARKGLPIVTVICGSQGSRQVNKLIQGAWPRLLEKVRLVHIVGPNDFQDLRLVAASLPAGQRDNLYLADFLSKGLPELFSASAVAVGRSGGTVFELAACRTPAVLLPLASAAQDHQRINAGILEAAGAAVVLDPALTTSDALADTVLALAADKERRKALSEAMAAFDRPEAADAMADALLAALEPAA